MAKKKTKAYQARARAQTMPLYFGGLMPPNFLIVDAGEPTPKDWDQRWQAVMQATWDEFRDLLGDSPPQQSTGYTTLKALESSLESRLQMVREKEAETSAYTQYHEIACGLLHSEGERYGWKTPLRVAFPGSIAFNSEESKRGWSKIVVTNTPVEGQVPMEEWERLTQDADLTFRVPHEYLDIHIRGTKPGDLSLISESFSAQTTFQEAAGRASLHYKIYSTSLNSLRRIIRLLEFRRSMVQNVLWQFEMYGKVEPLTQEQADEILRKEGAEPQKSGPKHRITDEELLDAINKVLELYPECYDESQQPVPYRIANIMRDEEISINGKRIAYDHAHLQKRIKNLVSIK